MRLRDAGLFALKQAVYGARRLFFGREPSDVPMLYVKADIDRLRRFFGRRCFASNWLLSYHYYGEDLNMRRPEYVDEARFSWRQIHIRGFDRGTGVALQAHSEPEPIAHVRAHLEKREVEIRATLARVSRILDKSPFGYRYVGV